MPRAEETKEIKSVIQLLVEGNDPRNFFEAFIEHLALADIQIQNFGGVSELGGFLRAFVTRQVFRPSRGSASFGMQKRPLKGRSKVFSQR